MRLLQILPELQCSCLCKESMYNMFLLCMELFGEWWVGRDPVVPITPPTPWVNWGKNWELKYILLAAWAAEERENWSLMDMEDMDEGGNIDPALGL